MSKPREFWIQQGTPDIICDDAYEFTHCVDEWRMENIPHYHVIEYSAVEALQSQVEKLQAENAELKKDKSIKRCGECGNVGMSNVGIHYISDLQSKLDKAISALKYLEKHIDEDGDYARKTLAELEK